MSEVIDAAILASVEAHWLKVARIVVDASRRLGAPDDDPRFEEIAERIVALVQRGELESQGNLSRWRYSEVRLPSRSHV
jgi:hypothetical protein